MKRSKIFNGLVPVVIAAIPVWSALYSTAEAQTTNNKHPLDFDRRFESANGLLWGQGGANTKHR
jgi:hypothetical protein